jgi:mono/diheme cytochrome c family protein
MIQRWLTAVAGLVMISLSVATVLAADLSRAQRGERALLGRAFNPPAWTATAYKNVWRYWDPKPTQPPEPYTSAFLEHYGLHPAPYPNAGYPMGIRESQGLLSKGITTDCLLCHGGSIAGQSYVGLGNATLDIQALFEDLAKAEGRTPKLPFTFSHVRGTSEAGGMSVYLLGWREPDLRMRTSRLELGLRDDLCEDVPAWWLLKKKQTMYYTGGANARSVRSTMQFMLSPLTPPSTFDKEEATFADIQAYILSLQAPKYPFAINRSLAEAGEKVFAQTCARCHGTYGENWTYPNKIVPLDEIGTDANRFYGISEAFVRHYNASWFGHERPGWLVNDFQAHATNGYQAPPLDGIWATAPYLHNGSVPTVYHVLNSKARPKRFTRSYRTDVDSYDPVKLGWKVEALERGADAASSPYEQRKIYDTTQPGRGNGGHTFGDKLTEEERQAVIEYLKTL